MPDGSLVAPETGICGAFDGSLSRDLTLFGPEFPGEIKAEIQMLLEAYAGTRIPVETVHSARLRRALVKRSGKLKVKLTTRSKPRVDPLIAKIAYEFLFLLGGRHLFEDENAETCDLLRDAIAGKSVQRLTVQRLQPDNTGTNPFTSSTLKTSQTSCVSGFFSSTQFTLCWLLHASLRLSSPS